MVSNCNKFVLVKEGDSCASLASANGISIDNFGTWNPSSGATSTCQGLWANAYACVGVIGSQPTTTPSTAPTTSSTTTRATTTTGNGIATPTPTQPNMFALVKEGDSCASVATANGISVANFGLWNPDSGATSTCQGLWANAYACVGVIGFTPTSSPTPTTSTTPTSTTKGNGVSTPTPTQTGMVGNCNKFVFIKSVDTCDSVAKAAGITTANFIKWNPAVGEDCKGLWANTYACIGLL
ncbi:hypothetical protein Daus18300_009802 [Diaporthe australafricana]|uniref:LysM domain-containing protein n=1 Tax=Diaporthe australafricana TaxID=127596 RepID=A0ABR3WD28_9PEZI